MISKEDFRLRMKVLLGALFALAVMICIHESAHIQICKMFGGNVTEISTFPNPHILCDVSYSPEYMSSQALVEAIGYSLSLPTLILAIMLLEKK